MANKKQKSISNASGNRQKSYISPPQIKLGKQKNQNQHGKQKKPKPTLGKPRRNMLKLSQ